MDKKYLAYSVEELCQDSKFIAMVRHGENVDTWERFAKENPEIIKNVDEAKEIVNSLRFVPEKDPGNEMYRVWKKVELLHSVYYPPKKKIWLKKVLPYAAIIILTLAIGAAIPTYYFLTKQDQFAELNLLPVDQDEAKLVLPDGEEILLENEQTDIQLDLEKEQIKIDQDKIIKLKEPTSENTMAQVVIPYGKRSNVELSDGTKVWLNAGSKLIFPQKFESKERKVYLTGEAYFEVAKNEKKPFVVSTNNMNVKVLGTRFNLKDNVSDDEVEVVLVEGKVSLLENNAINLFSKEIILAPKQKAVYNKLENKTEVLSNVDTGYYTSWKDGIFEFDRESILNVFKRLSRYYNVQFVSEKRVELNQKITGKLDLKESLPDVLRVIEDAAPVTCRIEENKVFVNSKLKYLPMK